MSYRERSIEVWTRGDDAVWRHGVVRESQTVELQIDARLGVRELYESAAEPSA